MTPAQWEDAMTRLCLDRDGASLASTLPGDPSRWLLYRDMVRTRIIRESGDALPRTRACFETERWRELIAGALADRVTQSRFYRDMPIAVATWILENAEVDCFFVRVDLAAIDVRDTEIDDGELATEMSLDGRCRAAKTARVVIDGERAAVIWRSAVTARPHVLDVPAWFARWFAGWIDAPEAAAPLLGAMLAGLDERDAVARLEGWSGAMATVIEHGGVVVAGAAES